MMTWAGIEPAACGSKGGARTGREGRARRRQRSRVEHPGAPGRCEGRGRQGVLGDPNALVLEFMQTTYHIASALGSCGGDLEGVSLQLLARPHQPRPST